MQLEIAREVHRHPRPVDEMFAESAAHFALYDNRNEPFHDRQSGHNPSLLPNYAAGTPALRLVALVAAGRVSFQGPSDLAFDYIDYELRSCRTTRSQNETGSYGPDRDKVDLLLASRTDRLPIIGEVKAATDRNPFLAFIQGLTYVVFTTSEHQLSRLNRWYPDRFVCPDSGPKADLYLFLIQYPQDNSHREFLKLTEGIARTLLEPGRHVAQAVRRIVCLDVNVGGDESARLHVLFSTDRAINP